MEIGCITKKRHINVIASTIVGVTGMQGLVNIANQMHQKAKIKLLFFQRGTTRFKYRNRFQGRALNILNIIFILWNMVVLRFECLRLLNVDVVPTA